MEEVTDEMILNWENAVRHTYRKLYSTHFAYLKDDLLQNGRLGVFMGYKTYVDEITNKCSLNTYIWYRLKSYMRVVIRHEIRHDERTTEYDIDTIESEEYSPLLKMDVERALTLLPNKERNCITKFYNGNNFRQMGCNRETARKRVYKAFEKLKRRLVV